VSKSTQRKGRSRTILIADDHAPIRLGLRAALETHGFSVCGEASDASTAVREAVRLHPDACLLDVHMPGNGISAARKISSDVPDTSVVMLTDSHSQDDLFDSLRAGATGYLLKDINLKRLPYVLEGVLRGEAALPRTLMAAVIEEFRLRERRRLELLQERRVALTAREWEVLDLMRQGLSTQRIADRLFISPATVRSHVAAVMKKLGVSAREDVIRLVNDS
jgi:DNA-binding NarL/FixJ family response regulator